MPNTPNCIPDAPQVSRDDLYRPTRGDLADLLSAGFIDGGTTIYPRSEKFAESSATINSGGTIELNGLIIDSLSAAAKHLTGRPTNGWWWTVQVAGEKLEQREIRQEYLDAQGCDDTEEDEGA